MLSSENQLEAEAKVEIHAPDIDVEAIMATIRHNLQHRQEAGTYPAIDFPEFEEATCPEEPTEGKYNPLLYYLLREMNQTYAPRFQVALDLAPSRLDKLPLVGFFWHALRRQLHGLAMFYASKIAAQMVGYNRYTVTILNLMTRQNQQQSAELAELKQRLAEIEIQLASLRQNS